MPTESVNLVINGRNNAQRMLDSFRSSLRGAQGDILKIASGIGVFRALEGSIRGAAAAMKNLIVESVKLSAQRESLTVQFGTMVGSLERGKVLMGEIIDLASRTPFQVADFAAGARTLLAFGGKEDTLMQDLKMLGDIAAVTGQKISEIALPFGQIRAAGRLLGQDLRQLQTRGIPVMEELALILRKDKHELLAMQRAGDITFEMVRQAFINMTQEGGRFADGMERQSKTLEGAWSNMMSAMKDTMAEFGNQLRETFDFEQLLPKANQFFGDIAAGLKAYGNLLEEIQEKQNRLFPEFPGSDALFPRGPSGNVDFPRKGAGGLPLHPALGAPLWLLDQFRSQFDAIQERQKREKLKATHTDLNVPLGIGGGAGIAAAGALSLWQMDFSRPGMAGEFLDMRNWARPDRIMRGRRKFARNPGLLGMANPALMLLSSGFQTFSDRVIDDPFFAGRRHRFEQRGPGVTPAQAFESRGLLRAPGQELPEQKTADNTEKANGLLKDIEQILDNVGPGLEKIVEAVNKMSKVNVIGN